eukprot:762846-Hanusia_phi.AAC.4
MQATCTGECEEGSSGCSETEEGRRRQEIRGEGGGAGEGEGARGRERREREGERKQLRQR